MPLIWGLHVIDIAILVGFLIAILMIGVWVSRGVKGETDFYLSGRKMGRVLQFFLNFGSSTDPTGAVVMASEVFRQGVGGIWLSLQTLFITPFYWFTQAYLRRARVTTMADLFLERFGSKAVASAYAGFNIYVVLLLLGMGSRTAFEVTSAMIVKSPTDYTEIESRGIDSFNEYSQLRNQQQAGTLPVEKQGRFEELDNLNRRGQLKSFVSYITPLPFYICYCAIVAFYIMLGGLKAAAITDAVQGILILIMSIILIPLGLHRIGGLHALHTVVPAYRFQLFGTLASSEYTWFSIFAITLGSLIQVLGLSHNMAVAGSARDEDTARVGIIAGGFAKRLVLIAWMFCGLLAIGLLTGRLAEPDQAWGQLSRELLMPGLMGLMLSGMLLGHMPSVGLSSVAVSGLVTPEHLSTAFSRPIREALSARGSVDHRPGAGTVDRDRHRRNQRGIAGQDDDHLQHFPRRDGLPGGLLAQAYRPGDSHLTFDLGRADGNRPAGGAIGRCTAPPARAAAEHTANHHHRLCPRHHR